MNKKKSVLVLLMLILLVFSLFVIAEEEGDDMSNDETPEPTSDEPEDTEDPSPVDDFEDTDSSDELSGWDETPTEEEYEGETLYGCWNSQPVANDNTIMNVEFEVRYQEKGITVNNKNIDVGAKLNQKTISVGRVSYSIFDFVCNSTSEVINGGFCNSLNKNCTNTVKKTGNTTCSNPLGCNHTNKEFCDTQEEKCYTINDENSICIGTTSLEITEFATVNLIDITEGYINVKTGEFKGHYLLNSSEEPEKNFSGTLNISQPLVVIGNVTLHRDDFVNPLTEKPELQGEITLEKKSGNTAYDVFFYDPITGKAYDDDDSTISKREVNLLIMAKLNAYAIETTKTSEKNTTNLTYPCAEEECLYPLPGQPPYEITNNHPNSYELYFVSTNNPEDDQLITGTFETDEYGNIRARKVSQQILYLNQDVDTRGFYGCNAPSFLNETTSDEGYCSIQGTHFCSYSTVHDEVGNREQYTTVNSWSDIGISQVGYMPMPEVTEEDIDLFYNNYFWELKSSTFSATKRNHSSSVVPARNFLSNAEFETSTLGLSHWEIIKDDLRVKDEHSFLGGEGNYSTITLGSGEILRSELVAVENNRTLHFTQNKSADITIFLVDKDGTFVNTITGTNNLTINTNTAVYLILEFTFGDVEYPMLQLVDDLGGGSYSYDNIYQNRAAAACCPENYCWNGHHCVEPMEETTNMVERVEEGRYYRCIAGEWTPLPVQWDWNAGKWGFCSEESQCFVLRDKNNAFAENTFETFYDGEYPTCVNNSEYIFDNYCDAGKWTSRTKVLATKLLEVAGSKDHILYCTNYRDNLVELSQGQDNYLGGGISQTNNDEQSLSEATSGQITDEIIQTCFADITDPEGQRLVNDKDNSCINNMCVLRYKQGGKFKTALATTLNKPIDDVNSFLLSLGEGLSAEDIAGICSGGSSTSFVKCDLGGLDIEGDLYYINETQGIIYSKDGISTGGSWTDKIGQWFSGLFGGASELSDETNFVSSAQNFRELYILNKDNKKVRVMREVYPGVKEMLIGEFEGFETNVCDYVNKMTLPEDIESEDLEKQSNMNKLACNNETQKIELVGALDFFWPKLTGQLRVGELD